MTADLSMRARPTQGALVVVDQAGQVEQTLVFQYDPGAVTRTLTPQIEDGDRCGPVFDAGPPNTRIEMTVHLSAPEPSADGLLPVLAALETLAYPALAEDEKGREQGVLSEAPAEHASATVLLVWGRARVVPVTLASIAITETAFDSALAPVAADVPGMGSDAND